MPHHHPRRQNGAELEHDLAARARESARPAVETVIRIADPADADELRARQRAALVRLLRQATEMRRAA